MMSWVSKHNPWPMMQRPELKAIVVAGLTAQPPRSHLLRGPSGIGKTTLAAQAAAALEQRGYRTLPIVAMSELTEVPLAGLAPLLSVGTAPSGPEAASDDIAQRVQQLIQRISRARDRSVLIVDDAPLLDAQSAAILYQLVRVFGVPTLLTARTEHIIQGPIQRLLHEQLLTIIDVPPLHREQVADLVQRYLHEPIRPESVQALHGASGGNPLLLRELVWSAQREGTVDEGPFGVEITAGPLPEHLINTVRGTLNELSPAARRLATLVAYAQPWPEELAIARDASSLQELQQAMIVSRSTRSDRTVIMLAHPLYAEALIQDLSLSEQAGIRTDAAATLLSTGHPDDRFVAACLLEQYLREHVPSSAPIAISLPADVTSDIAWAARRALAAGDPALALRLATTASVREPDHHAACLALAMAASSLGDNVTAENAFATALQLASDGRATALTALGIGQHWAYRRADVSTAVDMVQAIQDTLEPRDQAILAPELAKWRIMLGDQGALQAASQFDETGDPVAALGQAIGVAMVCTMLGDSTAAMNAVMQGRALIPAANEAIPHASSLLDLSEFLAAVADSTIDRARAIAERGRVSGPPEAAGIWSYTLALIAVHAGEVHAARDFIALATQQLTWRDIAGMQGAAAALHAAIAARCGDANASEALTDADGAVHHDIKVGLHLAEARLWQASPQERPAVAAALAATCVQALELGHHLLAALAASTALRLGCSEAVLPMLQEAAAASPARLVADVAAAAAAMAGSSGSGFDDAAGAPSAAHLVTRLKNGGLIELAESLAAHLHQGQGDGSSTLFAAATTPAGATDTAWAALTLQEQRVAVLASRRLRSREIAEQLTISVRTVDNHLSSVYRKLGVHTRDALYEALQQHGTKGAAEEEEWALPGSNR